MSHRATHSCTHPALPGAAGGALHTACALLIQGLLVVLAAAGAQAQQPDPSLPSVLPGIDETRPAIPEAAPEPEPLAPGRLLPVIPVPEDDRLESLLAEGRITITAFRFEGNRALDDALLRTITAPYLGPERGYSDLLEARDRVTRKYIDAGYISSGARLPPQDFAGGVVVLEIVEGGLDAIAVETDGRLRDRYLRSRVDAEGALDIHDLQKRLALLQNDPRVERVTAELVPGADAGSSLLSLEVEESTPWFTSAAFDNATPPSVGGLRGLFSAGHRNVTGFGDTVWASYGVAEGLHDLGGSYLLPLSGSDTSLELAVRRVWSEIVEEPFDVLDIESELESYRATVRQPLVRELARGVALFGTFEWKRGDSTAAGSALGLETTVAALRAGAEWWQRSGPRGWSVRGTLTGGLPALEASDEFASGLLQLQYVETLPGGLLPDGARIEARFDGQVASEDLPGIEQFALGGSGSVRGYRENRLVRDTGLVGSLELRVPLPLPELDPLRWVELGVFSDVGYAGNLGGTSNAEDLYSVGLGLHAGLWDYAELHVEWARALRDQTFSSEDDIQDEGLHFALLVHFP